MMMTDDRDATIADLRPCRLHMTVDSPFTCVKPLGHDGEHQWVRESWSFKPAEEAIADLRSRLAAAEGERDEWKANHNNAVKQLHEQRALDAEELTKRGKYIQGLKDSKSASAARVKALEAALRTIRDWPRERVATYDGYRYDSRAAAAMAAAAAAILKTKEG